MLQITFLLTIFVPIFNLTIVGMESLFPHHYPYNSILLYTNSAFIITGALLFFIAKKSNLQNSDTSSLQEKNNPLFMNKWIIDNIPNILCIKDPDGHWLQASSMYLNLLGLDNADYQGKTNSELSLLSRDTEKAVQLNSLHDEQTWEKGKTIKKIEKFTSPDLKAHSIEITKTPVYEAYNQPCMLIISGTNFTPGKLALRELQLTSTVFDHNAESILIIDSDFIIIRVNRSFTHLTGYQQNDVKGLHLSVIDHKQHNQVIYQTIQTYIKNNQQWKGEINCRRNNGVPFPAKLSLSPVKKSDGKTSKVYIGTLSDITHQKTTEKHIIRLAHYDDLTELPNRVMFIKRLNQILSRSKRHSLNSVLLFIDLDHFKSINDTIGHQGGDQLLKETAKRLTDSVRKEDIVARLSGDEFAILLDDHKTYEQASYAASLIANKIISILSESFFIQQRELFIGASIGIAIFPDDAKTAQDLLKHADIAMYQAKNQGRNKYHFFKQNYIVALNDRNQLEIDMRKALTQQNFRLFYQPQYDATSRELIGAEALVRWQKSHNEMVPPYYFISLAEETGLIIPLGQWILETACKRQKNWLDAGYPLNKVSVNISARQFTEPNFLQMVDETLKKTGLDPQHLELEITESMLMGDIKRVILKLQRLHNMGISLAIDDFGTGYSSLSYLKDFPIDILKIDQSFVRDIPESSKDAKIVCAIIEMGRSLGLKIVAEGVETEEHLKFLKQYKCDIIQGYLFNPPLPENEMNDLLQSKLDSVQSSLTTSRTVPFTATT